MNARYESTKNLIEIIALVLAGFWAIYIFIYQEHIAPANAVPRASIDTEIINLGSIKGGNAIKLKSKLSNNGKVRVYLVGYWFNVIGHRIEKNTELSDKQFSDLLRSEYTPNKYQIRARREYKIVQKDIIDSGTFVDDSWFLDQSDIIEQERTILFSDKYDLIVINVYANIAKLKDNIQYQWEIDTEDGEMRQVKSLVFNDGTVEAFDASKGMHMELRQEYGLGLIKSETVHVIQKLKGSEPFN